MLKQDPMQKKNFSIFVYYIVHEFFVVEDFTLLFTDILMEHNYKLINGVSVSQE